VAIDLAGKGGRLLLCVDDINRTPEAARLLRLAVSLAAPPSGGPGQAKPGGESPALADSLCQVVPVWPEQLSSLPPKVLEKPWVRTVAVGDLLPDEASWMIRAKVPSLSPVEARDYATRLHHDPFLVGLFTLMADEGMDAPRLGAVADDAIGQFLDAQLREICSAGAVDLLPVELRDGLAHVARESILRRNLRPLWKELEGWLGDGSKVLRGMRLLVRQGQVCRLDAEGRLDFRHDRLQERFLVQAMGGLLQLTEPPEDIITDPYYSAIVGKSLAQAELSAKRLTRLRIPRGSYLGRKRKPVRPRLGADRHRLDPDRDRFQPRSGDHRRDETQRPADGRWPPQRISRTWNAVRSGPGAARL
jgi:hypothetical protein